MRSNFSEFFQKRFPLAETIGLIVMASTVFWLKWEYHELWKDEWQAWFVSKDKNLWEILSFLHYEGHPALWYLFLKPFTWISAFLPVSEEKILSVAHVIPLLLSYFLFWKKLTLPTIVKLAFGASYFLIFEYGVVNRGYVLVLLFLLSSVYFLQKNNEKGLAWSLLLLCQTEVFGVFMALGLGGYYYINQQYKFRKPIQYLLIGLLLFFVSVFPRESGHIGKTQGKLYTLSDKIFTSFQGNLSNAFLPGLTPDTSAFGWNLAGLIFSLILLTGFWYIFRKEKNVYFTFMAVGIMFLSFSLFFFVGGIRQWGLLTLFLLAILSLTKNVFQHKISLSLLILIGIVQSIYGLQALQAEMAKPFTNARATGLYISEKIPEKVPVVAINKFEATPVIGYAKRPFYELPSGEPFTYFKWVEKVYIPTQQELKLFARYKGVGGIVIISPKKLDPERFNEAVLGKEFTADNIKNENYYLYTLTAK